jgi:hypothetical protein
MNTAAITRFLGRLILAPLNGVSVEEIQCALDSLDPWERIIKIADDNLITPALYSSFKSLNLLDTLPEDLAGFLSELHQCNAIRNDLIKKEAVQIALLFNKIGVEPLFLKGVAYLFCGIYPDSAARMMNDADILVPESSMMECVRILKEKGYYSSEDPTRYKKALHHYPPLVSDRKQAIVELHRHSFATQYRRLYSEEELWKSCVSETVDHARFHLPAPQDLIRYHLIHAHKHGGVYGPSPYFLRGLYDFAFLYKKYEGYIDWAELETFFNKTGLRKALVSHLIAAGHFCGYPVIMRDKNIKNTERLFLPLVRLYLRFPNLYDFSKLIHQYQDVMVRITNKREKRKEFIKKLMDINFHAKHFGIIYRVFFKK